MKIVLYHSPGACSLTSHIALEEAGAAYHLVRVNLAGGEQRRPEYLAINPHGRVPALSVDGTIVTENLAVLTWIANAFPNANLLPRNDILKLARVYELLSFFSSSVHVAFGQLWRPEHFAREKSAHPAVQETAREAILRYFAEIKAFLMERDWIVGAEFSAADTYPFVFHRWGKRIGVDMSTYPGWTAHTERMLSRPTVETAYRQEGLERSEFL